MTEEKQMYLEKYKIKNVVDGLKGIKRVQLEIPDKDDIIIDIPEWELAAVMTEKPGDLTDARNNRAIVVVGKIYGILKEMNVKVEEIGFIQQKLMQTLNAVEEKAINEKFGVDNKHDIRINHWDK